MSKTELTESQYKTLLMLQSSLVFTAKQDGDAAKVGTWLTFTHGSGKHKTTITYMKYLALKKKGMVEKCYDGGILLLTPKGQNHKQ
jgi:hypothetical protein